MVDPAVGSGHFVVAAARRIATALAADRTGDSEPGPQALRTATADVIERCIYGVDLNDLAIEITKVALWLEAFDGSRPFPFLDAHLKVGNSLLGTTPALLRENIPDTAFTALGDDNKTWTSKLKARNKAERERHAGQLTISDSDTLEVETVALTKKARVLEDTPASTLAQARARADAWRRLEEDPELAQRKLAADAWCAAFVQPKSPDHGQGITHDTIRQIVENPGSVPAAVAGDSAGNGSAVPLLPLAPGVPRHLHGSGLRHCRRRPHHWMAGWVRVCRWESTVGNAAT